MRKIFTSLVSLLAFASVALAQFTDQRTWGGTSGGSANAQTISIANYATYTPGVVLRFVAGFTNTGPTTLNVSTIGTRNVYRATAAGAAALSGGEIVAGQLVEVTYDGAQLQIVSTPASPLAALPGGYLTPCPVAGGVGGCTAGTQLPTGDVSAVSTLYYTPVASSLIPIYNGGTFVTYSFAELTLTIPASRLANTIYDVCVTTTTAGAFANNGTPTVVFGPAWTNSAAGTAARGSGAGTAQIARVNGLWTNAVQISAVNGAATYTVPANQCTTVATVQIGGSNGQVSYSVTYGQNRVWPSFNLWNRLPLTLVAGDSTGSWPYTSGTIRASNGSSANRLTYVLGLQEEEALIWFAQRIDITGTAVSAGTFSGSAQSLIGVNSIVAGSGSRGYDFVTLGNNTTVSISIGAGNAGVATYVIVPALGPTVVNALESGGSGASYSGTEPFMSLRARWRG